MKRLRLSEYEVVIFANRAYPPMCEIHSLMPPQTMLHHLDKPRCKIWKDWMTIRTFLRKARVWLKVVIRVLSVTMSEQMECPDV